MDELIGLDKLMNLNDDQKQTVKGWVESGLKLSDIQKKIGEELGVHLTYMEVRFLVDDLKVIPKDPPKPVAPVLPAKKGAEPEKAIVGADPLKAAAAARTGGVSVSIDQVTRPGSMVSGKVTFSDGNNAEWYLDQFGRLGLAPKVEGYRPSPQDLTTFQTELQKELQRAGF